MNYILVSSPPFLAHRGVQQGEGGCWSPIVPENARGCEGVQARHLIDAIVSVTVLPQYNGIT